MALLLQLRTRTKMNTFANPNPSLFHFYSTSNSNDDEPESTLSSTGDASSENPNSSISSYFSDVKKVLKQGQSTSPLFAPKFSSNLSSTAAPTPSESVAYEEIRKNLSEFRRRYSDTDSTPPSSPSSNQISLQEIFKRNMVGKEGESKPNADLKPGKIGSHSIDAIRESLRNMKQNVQTSGSDRKVGSSGFIGSQISSTVSGGTGSLPSSIFGKELRENEREESSEEMKMGWFKTYRHEELGEKLRKLRPQAKGGDWFSLRELNDRLVKMREIEEKEREQSPKSGKIIKDFKNILLEVKTSEEKEKNRSRK